MYYSLSFGVNGVFLETRFPNNDRVFLSTRTKFRILLYFYLVIDFYLVTELEMVLEKNQRANHTGILFDQPSPTDRAIFREGNCTLSLCAEPWAWDDGSTAVLTTACVLYK